MSRPPGNEPEGAGADLLRRMRRRDRAALEELSMRYGSALTRAAYLHLGDAHGAADACQETLIAAWDGARRTTDRTPLRSWLFGILFHQCRKHLRSLSRRRRREARAAEIRGPVILPEGSSGSDERLSSLRRALAGLEETLRAVVVLRYEEGMSVAQTAATLGIPEGTVKSRTHSALGQMRQVMEGES